MPHLQATSSNMLTIASTLTELLAYNDKQFVQCAYQTLLGRSPDPEGLAYYLSRLRTGFSKIQILKQLRMSSEGREHGARLPSLDIAIQRHRKGRYPIIGWLFRLFYGIEGNHPTERKLRGIENEIYLLSDESHRRFNQLETALSSLYGLVAQQKQSVVMTTSASQIATAPEELKQLTPRARNIYYKLKTAAAINDGRTA
jgi:Domain of unknown function (DUF4214)